MLFLLLNVSSCWLQIIHGDVITYRQNVDKLAEQQQSKYLDLYTILPSEISMQLAEVSLALGAIEDQVNQHSGYEQINLKGILYAKSHLTILWLSVSGFV